MRSAEAFMPSLGNDRSVVKDDASDERIGRNVRLASLRQLYGSSHRLINGHRCALSIP
jgi:hypothetical protein